MHITIILHPFLELEIFFQVHIPDLIIYYLKLSINVITIRIRTDNTRQLFHQSQRPFVIRIIYTTYRNSYGMINIINDVYQLN